MMVQELDRIDALKSNFGATPTCFRPAVPSQA
jgi:hypothetical protein